MVVVPYIGARNGSRGADEVRCLGAELRGKFGDGASIWYLPYRRDDLRAGITTYDMESMSALLRIEFMIASYLRFVVVVTCARQSPPSRAKTSVSAPAKRPSAKSPRYLRFTGRRGVGLLSEL